MTATSPHPDDADVLAVVVTYQAARFVTDCLAALERSSRRVDVVVVDNGSSDGTADVVRRAHPGVTVIAQENLGFSAGNNRGIADARRPRHRFAFLVNPDVVVDPDCAARLASHLDAAPGTAIACPKILRPDGRTIWFAGSRIDWDEGVTAHVGEGEIDDGRHDRVAPMDRACGAAMMVRLAAADAVGPMPEEYFLYFEETDWSRRFVAAGHALEYVPSATCRHDVSSSTGADSPLVVYYMTRNLLLFMSRHGREHLPRFREAFARRCRASARRWLRHPGGGNLTRLAALVKGRIDFRFGRLGRRW